MCLELKNEFYRWVNGRVLSDTLVLRVYGCRESLERHGLGFASRLECKLALSEFCLRLVRDLIEEYGSKCPQARGRPPIDSFLRLIARHFIAFIQGNNVQERCFVCRQIYSSATEEM